MSQPGRYAGRTLAQKWCVNAERRVWLGPASAEVRLLAEAWLEGARKAGRGIVDLAFVFPRSLSDWRATARKLRRRLSPAGAIWVVFPKKAAAARLGFDAQFTDMIAAVADLGLMDNKTCAVNEDYTSTRFSIRRGLRRA